MQPLSCLGIIYPSLCSSVEIVTCGTQTNADTMAPAFAMNNKLLFVSEPEILHFLPISMDWLHINL